MRKTGRLGTAGVLLVWLSSCARSGLEGDDLLASDAGSGVSRGGSANVAGNADGGASASGELEGNASSGSGHARATGAGGSDFGLGGLLAGSAGTFDFAGSMAGSAGEAFGGDSSGGDTFEGVPGDGPDLYVDPTTGDDTQPGTRAQPLRTIARAASLARSGSNITLLDGTYDATNQSQFVGTLNTACGVDSGVAIPSGATLRADHSGAALLSIASYHGLCMSGGRIDGLRIARPTLGKHVVECDRGVLEINETSFSNVGFYAAGQLLDPGATAALVLSGSARATVTPGNLQNYAGGPVSRFARIVEQASLTIVGGKLSASEDPSSNNWDNPENATFKVTDSAALILHDVELQEGVVTAVPPSETAIAVDRGAQLRLDQSSSISGFVAGIYATFGAYQVTVDDVDFFANTIGIDCKAPSDSSLKSLHIDDSRFAAEVMGISMLALNVELAIQHSTFETHRSYQPSECDPALELAGTGSVMLDDVTVADDDCGLELDAWNGPLALNVSVRNSRFSANGGYGVLVTGNGTTSTLFDFGTVASPGNNTFQGNHLTELDNANFVFGEPSPGTGNAVLAVGNTWDSVQGADATGHYAVSGQGARLEVAWGGGPNYRLPSNAVGRIRLAENP